MEVVVVFNALGEKIGRKIQSMVPEIPVIPGVEKHIQSIMDSGGQLVDFFPILCTEDEGSAQDFVQRLDRVIQSSYKSKETHQQIYWCLSLVLMGRFNLPTNRELLEAVNNQCTQKTSSFLNKVYIIESNLKDGTRIDTNESNFVDLVANFMLLLTEEGLESRIKQDLTRYLRPEDVFPTLTELAAADPKDNSIYAAFNVHRIQYPAKQVADYCATRNLAEFLDDFLLPAREESTESFQGEIQATSPATNEMEEKVSEPPTLSFRSALGRSQSEKWVQNFREQLDQRTSSTKRDKLLQTKVATFEDVSESTKDIQREILANLDSPGGLLQELQQTRVARESIDKRGKKLQQDLPRPNIGFQESLRRGKESLEEAEAKFLKRCDAIPSRGISLAAAAWLSVLITLSASPLLQERLHRVPFLTLPSLLVIFVAVCLASFYFLYVRFYRLARKSYNKLLNLLPQISGGLTRLLHSRIQHGYITLWLQRLRLLDACFRQSEDSLQFVQRASQRAHDQEKARSKSPLDFQPVETEYTSYPIQEPHFDQEVEKKYIQFAPKQSVKKWSYQNEFIQPLFREGWVLLGYHGFHTRVSTIKMSLVNHYLTEMENLGILELVGHDSILDKSRKVSQSAFLSIKLPIQRGRGPNVSTISEWNLFAFADAELYRDLGLDAAGGMCEFVNSHVKTRILMGKIQGNIRFFDFNPT